MDSLKIMCDLLSANKDIKLRRLVNSKILLIPLRNFNIIGL